MEQQIKKDIFISYKNDGSGNQFANRLCQDLKNFGYAVYFNPHERHSDSFPEELRTAILNCRDFILILSAGCLEQLKRHETIDWVREELLTAHQAGKHIIPITMDGVNLPKNADDMSEDLRFLPDIKAINFPEQYVVAPLDHLRDVMLSKNYGSELYKDTFNSNPDYCIHQDYLALLEKAQNGDIAAMYEVGMMCFYGATDNCGENAAWDYDNAAYWLKKVAESDNQFKGHALNILARMYYQGIMPREQQSYEKAYQLHCSAAELGNENSVTEQAFMLRVGAGCNFDYNNVVDFYHNKFKNGDSICSLEMAEFYTKYGKFKEAAEIYDTMTSTSPEAEYRLGIIYRDGVTTDPPKPDYFRAAYHFHNAADENHLMAALEYGILHFRPSAEIKKNFRIAQKYFTLAADGGVAIAQYLLGYMYRTGLVEKDYEKAIYYLEKARQQGHSYAELELSMLYQQPECQNFHKAFECAQLAASHGISEGELILGNLYFWGRGCSADVNKAYEMYEYAFSHGLYYAQVMMKKIDNGFSNQ